jgi:hypothetical protein
VNLNINLKQGKLTLKTQIWITENVGKPLTKDYEMGVPLCIPVRGLQSAAEPSRNGG